MKIRINFADGSEKGVDVICSVRSIEAISDETIGKAGRKAEKATGKPLPIDPRTNFPNFTVYDFAGEEIMGG